MAFQSFGAGAAVGDIHPASFRRLSNPASRSWELSVTRFSKIASLADGTYPFEIGGQQWVAPVRGGQMLFASNADASAKMTLGNLFTDTDARMLPQAVITALGNDIAGGRLFRVSTEATEYIAFGAGYALDRLKAWRSLMGGKSYASAAAMQADGWDGPGLAVLAQNNCRSEDDTLHRDILHGCGAWARQHWKPYIGATTAAIETWVGGTSSTKHSLRFYLRPVLPPLPITDTT